MRMPIVCCRRVLPLSFDRVQAQSADAADRFTMSSSGSRSVGRGCLSFQTGTSNSSCRKCSERGIVNQSLEFGVAT